MKGSSAPDAPNPAVTIPLQGAENRQTFDYQLGQMRTNTAGPTGTTSWSNTPTFDQAGYDKAMADWKAQQPAAAPAPTPYQQSGGGTYQNPVSSGMDSVANVPQLGYVPPPAPVGTMPTQDQFTNKNWTLTTQLSPEQQALYDTNTQSQLGQAGLLKDATSRTADSLASSPDWANIPQLSSSYGNTNIAGVDPSQLGSTLSSLGNGPQFDQNLADSIYNEGTRYLDPQVAIQKRQLEASLADQGFTPGTPGYAQAMQTFNDSNNRQYAQARDTATTAATAQGNTQYGQRAALAQQLAGLQQQGFAQAGQKASFGNTARTQAIAEMLQQRLQPLSELNALRTGTSPQIPQANGTSSTPGLNAPDILGALNNQYQGQLGNYSAGVSSNNALLGAGAGLLGSTASQWGPWLAALLSDRRFKTDIVPDGKLANGIPLYKFRYIGKNEIHRGVMADEAEKVVPEAVVRDSFGFSYVDYSKLGGE